MFRMIHSWQNSLDKSEVVGTVLMDLSKAYDCLPHDLLIAKLAAYGLDINSLNLLFDYLINLRKMIVLTISIFKVFEVKSFDIVTFTFKFELLFKPITPGE